MIKILLQIKQAVRLAHGDLGKVAASPRIFSEKVAKTSKARGERILLFIHGVDYNDPREVDKDFVKPIVDVMGEEYVRRNFDQVASVCWNSLLLQEPMRSALYKTPTKKILTFAASRGSWPKFFADAEKRAIDTARFLAETLSADSLESMTVITHSLGSLVWAKTLQFFIEKRGLTYSPGRWINLQPALPMDCFTESGVFSSLPRLFNRTNAQHEIWHSKEDFVLRIIYPYARKSFALGQRGCPEKTFKHRDITSLVREAHGVSHIRQAAGNFFHRIAPYIAPIVEPLAGKNDQGDFVVNAKA